MCLFKGSGGTIITCKATTDVRLNDWADSVPCPAVPESLISSSSLLQHPTAVCTGNLPKTKWKIGREIKKSMRINIDPRPLLPQNCRWGVFFISLLQPLWIKTRFAFCMTVHLLIRENLALFCSFQSSGPGEAWEPLDQTQGIPWCQERVPTGSWARDEELWPASPALLCSLGEGEAEISPSGWGSPGLIPISPLHGEKSVSAPGQQSLYLPPQNASST